MTAGTTGPATREASASWQALGTGVQVIVTSAGQVHTIGGWPAEAAGGIP